MSISLHLRHVESSTKAPTISLTLSFQFDFWRPIPFLCGASQRTTTIPCSDMWTDTSIDVPLGVLGVMSSTLNPNGLESNPLVMLCKPQLQFSPSQVTLTQASPSSGQQCYTTSTTTLKSPTWRLLIHVVTQLYCLFSIVIILVYILLLIN